MRFLTLAFAVAALAACADPAPQPEAPAPAPPEANAEMALFDFEGADASEWNVVNDGVMGGDSQGFVEVADGALVFTGDVVTEGGGFTSIRTERDVDLSAYQGVEMRVKGGGRSFQLEIDDDTERDGREVSRRATFETTDDWRTVRVPFADLETTVFGEPVEAEALDASDIEEMGLFIADGQDGPFRLEVDWMRAY